ncbi:LytR/AlgR family response regulator transcription factor [Paenibacillus donghaensis]|uniref:DNA-binding response regulator n=1 Tax=Paenibacillus donghaensis TaxID=414771 RepID=A0A2Z2KNU5_9BACL|nr:response regulator transcription factor [Paenibacillus donghaensis]ASA25340.1 DNA-binding response regulator [Paenibacillus donghaensis]
MFQVAVCDDKKEEHAHLEQFFMQLTKSTPFTFHTYYFSCGEELLLHYKKHDKFPFHFLILGIEMKGINGIETAKKIRSLPDRDVQIIFLSSCPKYMMDSFDVQTFQYLIRPVSFELFKTKIVKLCNYIITSVNKFLTIKVEGEYIVLRTFDIIAIVKIKHSLIKNKLKIITAKHQYIITGILLEYANKLEYPFLLIHRSVIVNLEHIRNFTAVSVFMSNEDQFPIGRSHSKNVKDTYARYMLTQFKERG